MKQKDDKKIVSLAQRRIVREQQSAAGLPVVKTFRAVAQSLPIQPMEESLKLQDKLNKERLREVQFKNYFRMIAAIFFGVLLAGQNFAVFFVILKAFELDRLKDLQLIFAALSGATLTETYFVTKIIINFIFSTTDYSYKKN